MPLGFTILFLLLLRSQLHLWDSPFFFFFLFFFCVPSFFSGVHHSSSSSSAFPAISLWFTIFLLLRSQLYLWGSPFFFCVPSYIVGLTILLLLRSQLYRGAHHFLVRLFAYVTGFFFFFFFFNPTIEAVTIRLCGWCMLGVFLLPAVTRLEHACLELSP